MLVYDFTEEVTIMKTLKKEESGNICHIIS